MFSELCGRIKMGVPLGQFTTWKVGGASKYYFAPTSIREIVEVVSSCYKFEVPYFVLGNGSNILINDNGFAGMVLHLGRALQHIEIKGSKLIVGSGYATQKLSFQMAKMGYGGFEFYAGIPGTVGGAVALNAGAAGSETKDLIKSVTYLTKEGKIITENVDKLGFEFRRSKILGTKSIILSVDYKLLERYNPKDILKINKEIIDRRRKKFPINLFTAGSVFKSRPGGPYPGELIEKVGLKGYKIGDSQISNLHANWIINVGNAKSNDIKDIINIAQNKVKEAYGIQLEREVIYIPEDLKEWR